MTQIKGTIDLRYFQERELFLAAIMSRSFTFTAPNILDTIFTAVDVINIIDRQIKCKTLALWDTGATGCCITKSLAEKLNLIPEAYQRKAHFLDGERLLNVYLIELVLPNNIIAPKVEVVEWAKSTRQDIDIIIGMDLISQGDFTISNFEGKTKFGFRFPSYEHIELESGKSAIKKD